MNNLFQPLHHRWGKKMRVEGKYECYPEDSEVVVRFRTIPLDSQARVSLPIRAGSRHCWEPLIFSAVWAGLGHQQPKSCPPPLYLFPAGSHGWWNWCPVKRARTFALCALGSIITHIPIYPAARDYQMWSFKYQLWIGPPWGAELPLGSCWD